MRLSIVTLLLQFSLINLAFAQVKPAKPMENAGQHSQKYTLGLRIGPSLTIGHLPKNLPDTILDSHSNKVKLGFTAVGQLTFPLQKSYSCLIELGYSRGGRKIEYNDKTWQNDFTYNYITASLALRRAFQFRLRESLYADWYLSVGPNISYMISGNGQIKTDNGGRSAFDLVFHNLSDSAWYEAAYNDIGKYHFNKANRFFFGVDIGVGAYAPITNRQKVYVELRTTLGQKFIRKRDTKATLGGIIGGVTDPANPDLNQGVPGQFSDPLTTNMKTFTLSLIYTFDFDKRLSKQGKSTLDKKRKSPGRRR
jgi:hypothetical protein